MFRNKVDRSKAFKKGLDTDDCRRKREDESFGIRKAKRDEQLVKRRMVGEGKAVGADNASDQPAIASSIVNLELAAYLKDLSPQIVNVNSADCIKQLEAMRIFRKLVSIETNPPIQNVIDAGVVPRIVELMSNSTESDLAFEAAWVLTNIASGTDKQTQHVIRCGAIPKFVQLLGSRSEDCREQAVWALGNIAGDSCQARNIVLQAQALPALIRLCVPQTKLSTLRNAVWAISNCCRGKPQPDFMVIREALPVLAQLVHHTDEEILTDTCWALSYLSDDKADDSVKISTVIESGCVPKLVQLLSSKAEKVRTPVLRTLGNLVTGNDIQTQHVLNCGLLKAILPTLSDMKKTVKKEACWALSNITAGTKHQIQLVIDAQLMPPLIGLLRGDQMEIRKEAAWTVSNAASNGDAAQIKYLVQNGAVQGLSDLFEEADSKVLMVALEGLDGILKSGKKGTSNSSVYSELVEECGGLDKLEALQRHDNEEIYQKSMALLKAYFDSDENDNTPAGPEPAQNQNQFMFGGSSSSSNNGGFNFGSSAPLPVVAQQQQAGFGFSSSSGPMFSFA